uniref:Uncharacterized protein n=1 Tax=Octopus bimaculoides TaxID=37653 RepID=A0A0L8HMR9_OCTBM
MYIYSGDEWSYCCWHCYCSPLPPSHPLQKFAIIYQHKWTVRSERSCLKLNAFTKRVKTNVKPSFIYMCTSLCFIILYTHMCLFGLHLYIVYTHLFIWFTSVHCVHNFFICIWFTSVHCIHTSVYLVYICIYVYTIFFLYLCVHICLFNSHLYTVYVYTPLFIMFPCIHVYFTFIVCTYMHTHSSNICVC